MYWLMAHWLGQKYKSKIPAILQKFTKDNTFCTKVRKLVRPDTYKAKRFVARTWHNPYTEKDDVKKEKERIKRESLFRYDNIRPGESRGRGMVLHLGGVFAATLGAVRRVWLGH